MTAKPIKNVVMKKMLFLLLILASGIVYASPVIDEKILNTFKGAFPKAETVSWYKDGNTYLVYFTNDQVKCRMWYDASGEVLKTIRYYDEQNLCPFILTKVKQKYADKKVYGVTEVSSNEGVKYNIVLEDEKKWYHVSVDFYGTLRLDKKYNKA
jgi:hypothetical protein